MVVAVSQLILIVTSHFVSAQEKPAGSSTSAQVSKAVGIIKSLQPDSITVAAESGGEVTARITASTKILRVPPGEKDLKNASTVQAQDLQTGDRVLVRGQAAADGKTIAALSIIVMKQADVAAKQQHDREDWQKRGVGGLVTKTDPATGTVTISSGGVGTSQNIAVHIDKKYDFASLLGRLGQVRRCQTVVSRSDQGWRSTASAGDSQPGRQRHECGGSCHRRVSQYCGHHQVR
jgi:hypothetical protein